MHSWKISVFILEDIVGSTGLPTYPTTYGLGGNYVKNGDQEIMCRIAEWDIRGIAMKDWSHGRYSKNWPIN